MKQIISRLLLVSLVSTLIACAGASHSERNAKTGVLIGTATGAALGQAIGKNTEGTLIGAGIGALVGGLAGHQVGRYMDQQEAALRSAMAQSEATSVYRNRDVLTATFRSEVLFDTGSAVLKPGAYGEVSRVADVLNRYPETTIRVEGHTDARGTEAYNLRLSEARAAAVKNALIQRGVDPARIRAMGYGESQPVSSQHAMNRRVDIVIEPVVSG